jgi:predicted nucleic acid-binding protein
MPTKQGNTGLLERYKRLLDSLKMLEITPDVYDEALEFRAFHNLKTPDALH